jgi:hypothetical protein
MWHVFSSQLTAVSHHDLPRISPRFHHQITINKQPTFPETTLKNARKTARKRHLHAPDFFLQISKNGPAQTPCSEPHRE